MDLNLHLAALLKQAGLPKESDLIGKSFSFTYAIGRKFCRVSGKILGLKISIDDDDERALEELSFNLLTTPIPSTKISDTNHPTLFFDSSDNCWKIIFWHNSGNGMNSMNATELYRGEFSLLE